MDTWLFSRLEFIDNLHPPHNVDDIQKVQTLGSSLQTDGWIGPPLIIVGNQALTGTHRLAAAKSAGIRLVPVIELSSLAGVADGILSANLTREEIKNIINSLPESIKEQYAASISSL